MASCYGCRLQVGVGAAIAGMDKLSTEGWILGWAGCRWVSEFGYDPVGFVFPRVWI